MKDLLNVIAEAPHDWRIWDTQKQQYTEYLTKAHVLELLTEDRFAVTDRLRKNGTQL